MKKCFSFFLLFLPFAVMAHEGHGHTESFTIIHYLAEPLHLLTGAVVLITLVLLYKNMKRREKKA